MGRRKQFCPQRTGGGGMESLEEGAKEVTRKEEKPDTSGEEEDQEESEGRMKKSLFRGESTSLLSSLLSPLGTGSDAGVKPQGHHPFLTPATLLSLNPSSLYAVQLAQIQAAQLLAQRSLKRKRSCGEEEDMEEEEDPEDDNAEEMGSPLDLSGVSPPKKRSPPPFSKEEEEDYTSDKVSESNKRTHFNTGVNNKPRHSAWQSQWINRGEENSKDIFKCAWCKETFDSFQTLTVHIKETQHFGSSSLKNPSPPETVSPPAMISPAKPSGSVSPESATRKRDILKEQLPIPRKLVRGQDVWLGRGEEQTRNILKCMWCGESFRSLDVMTKHMQETKHYTKVISQDQISNWKSAARSQSPKGEVGGVKPPSPIKDNVEQINAVLSCKICDASFSSLKDLSDHMVQNNHYITLPPKSPVKNSPPPTTINNNFLFAPKEKRKKSLPVRKLLEMERSIEQGTSMKFPCDRCGISFPFHRFAEHIRTCTGFKEQSVSPPFRSRREEESISPVESRRIHGEDKNILGSLEQMVSGNFHDGGSKEDVVIPIIKNGADEEDIAVIEEEESPVKIKSSRKKVEENNKNPLEALQMLCDKNEKQSQNYYGGNTPHLMGSPTSSSSPDPALLNFPWSPSPEALFKCPFCESPFVSKGAYRHHLSKMHFVKDPSVMRMMDPSSIMAIAAGIPPNFLPPHSPAQQRPPPIPSSPERMDENSQSKFEKYSQLAKQLSNQRKPLSSPA